MSKVGDSNADKMNKFIRLIWAVCILNIWLAVCKKCPYLEFSSLYFQAFGLNSEIYRVSLVFSLHAGKYGPGKLQMRAYFMQSRVAGKFFVPYLSAEIYFENLRNTFYKWDIKCMWRAKAIIIVIHKINSLRFQVKLNVTNSLLKVVSFDDGSKLCIPPF